MTCAALLLAAACGGDEAREPAAQAPADSQPGPAAPAVANESGTSVAAPAPQSGASAPQAGTEPAPSPADSAAAAREDVSPEWKMRERGMASYAQCMEQARSVEPPMRERLESACERRSGAP